MKVLIPREPPVTIASFPSSGLVALAALKFVEEAL